MKVALIVTAMFGKREEGVSKYYGVFEDTPENRKEALDYEGFLDLLCYDDLEGFIEGRANTVYFDNEGDWDDPTGFEVKFSSKGRMLAKADEEHRKAVKSIEKLFDEEL